MPRESAKVSFPFLSILTLIFITLKLCNVIAWSWWAVLSPIWLPLLLVMAFLGICLIVAILRD